MGGLKLFWFWLLPILMCAEFVHWHGDYAKALDLARKENKPLLVLVTRTHDTNTSAIVKHSFANSTYVHTINEKTVPVIVYVDKYTSYPIEMYYTTLFPTLFLVDSRQERFLYLPLYPHMITPEMLSRLFSDILVNKQ